MDARIYGRSYGICLIGASIFGSGTHPVGALATDPAEGHHDVRVQVHASVVGDRDERSASSGLAADCSCFVTVCARSLHNGVYVSRKRAEKEEARTCELYGPHAFQRCARRCSLRAS
jgi:hypothetical protein